MNGGAADWHLSHPSIRKEISPTIGFSLQQAALAEKVTVIGNSHHRSPDEQLNILRVVRV
jgi:hypothetical protein